MRVIESNEKSRLVRADSKEAKNGFRQKDDEGEYDYYLPLTENINFDFNFTNSFREGTEPNYVPILNIKTDRIGIVGIDAMVEPVDFTVNVERKEG